ncbi:hypothetical protein Gasu2_50890 [Galdieria sulphuraria]|nr:hypothetical protein Gasu2_50890 [Galdieria sulphuraria]
MAEQSLVQQLLWRPPTYFDSSARDSREEKPVRKTLALELLLGSLPTYSNSSQASTSIESQHSRKPVRYDFYEDWKKDVKSFREKLEKRKKHLEDCGLPLSVLFCYHIPLHFTESSFCNLLFEQLRILGVTSYHMEWSNNKSSRVCWVHFISDEWCELAAFRLVQVVEEGENIPFEFSFSLPKNDDVVQWKTNKSKKRKRTSKLENSLTHARQLGLEYFRKFLSDSTDGLTHVRMTEPLLRRRPGKLKQQICLIETSRLGWATYASEFFLLNALARLKTLSLQKLGISSPKIDETASKQKQHPESFISQRQKRSQISALESSEKRITFIHEK